jgi:glycosyltransferase involved in cell wall biosynthesis
MNKQDGGSSEGTRILIVADNASARFGGEAFLPLNYFRFLRERNLEVWLVTHARTREELTTLRPGDTGRMTFVPDTFAHKLLWKLSSPLPQRLAELTFGFVSYLLTQWIQRRVVIEIVRKHRIDVVHQPTPVSPRLPSLLYGLGVPVVLGPMNGGMEYPPNLRKRQNGFTSMFVPVARAFSNLTNLLIPGKLLAHVLLVANDRTRRALPAGTRGEVLEMVENGVDLSIWRQPPSRSSADSALVRFIFVGRLVDWKAVDLLIEAFAIASCEQQMILQIVGDGPVREDLEKLAQARVARDRICFSGWLSQKECAAELAQADVFVLPSLFECGGAVVLEAMATGLPVIATNWGGPADYLDSNCGILIDISSREAIVHGFAEAMKRLARDREARAAFGLAARSRALDFDWERKIDRILEVYRRLWAFTTSGVPELRSIDSEAK